MQARFTPRQIEGVGGGRHHHRPHPERRPPRRPKVAHAGVEIGPSGSSFAPRNEAFLIESTLEALIEERILSDEVEVGLHFQLLDEVVVPGQPASERGDAADPTVHGSAGGPLSPQGVQARFGHGVHASDGQRSNAQVWSKAGGVKGGADGTGHRPSVRFSSFLEEGIDEGQRGHFSRFWPVLQHAGLEACVGEGRPWLIARDALQTEGSLEQRGPPARPARPSSRLGPEDDG